MADLTDTERIPPIPEDLLRFLEKRFPTPFPGLDWSDRKIWMELGKAHIVTFLRASFNAQKAR